MGKRDEDREISLSIVLKDDGLKALKRNLTHERFYLALKDTSSPGAWTQIWVCIRRLKYERASYSDSTNKPNRAFGKEHLISTIDRVKAANPALEEHIRTQERFQRGRIDTNSKDDPNGYILRLNLLIHPWVSLESWHK
ncbi:hypothetical protein DI09_21p300 [Mitosporidium daphniae]|uniref:Uncharacterized protein n=1 Tax=Mitosporidium daphniae TaxID=1485682 RepID=A0A098VSJ5_9MICR|nr:uncharacterized protein DI09_21p300 [Mitosporidium daphniae]KGG52058.1 hypothetical protein DI09_21p300 [Mitosporidium daphniae]|eukprot:XP_013238485.1 uncharacterized protein DI09_21p300 [Mitosporidium daphniae]